MRARHLVVLGVIALVTGLLAVAGPALSARPYQPAAVSFGMAAPERGLGKSPERGFVSRTVAAPKRFDLVGLSWKGDAEPAIAIRTRAAGGAWSAWTPLPPGPDGAPDPGSGERSARAASEPLWAAESDYVQYRMSRRPPGLRLEFVNATGTATPLDRAATAVREVVNDGVMAVASVASAEAGTEQPRIVRREAWGADDCVPRRPPSMGTVDAAFVHHTVTGNGYSRSDVKPMVLSICQYHRYTRGWDDIGYNFLVDRFGRIFEGRAGGIDQAVQAAHAQGFNDQSVGVATLGRYGSERLSRAGRRATASLLAWKLTLHGVEVPGTSTLVSGGGEMNRYPEGRKVTVKNISGHRDVGLTNCPGDRLYDQLTNIRERVRRKVASG
jgi:uncharacterized protein with LGFP repeats